jgi:hypothetical protein
MSRFRRSYDDAGGARKGALGKFDPPNKINRNDPWEHPEIISDGNEGLSVADRKAKHTSNFDNVLNRKHMTPPRETNAEARDIYSDVCKNSLDDDAGGSRPGPIKYGVD